MANQNIFGRPGVLPNGTTVVLPPQGATIGFHRSRWGVQAFTDPLPQPHDGGWPLWPLVDTTAASQVLDLLSRVNTEGAPLGYLGPKQAEVEAELAGKIADLAPAGAPAPYVFAVQNGSVALQILYKAVLYKATQVERRRFRRTPEMIAQARSFEATWTQMQAAGVRPVIVDINESNGCLDVVAAEAAITAHTVAVVATALYDSAPDLDGLEALALRAAVPLLIDSAHGHLVTWRGTHLAYHCTGLTISGQSSKVITPGAEFGFIVTTDPIVAAYVAMIRNVGRTPTPLPAWWPTGVTIGRAMGGNFRPDEIDSLLMSGSMRIYDAWHPQVVASLAAIRAALAQHPELPWQMLPLQPELAGLHYKGTLVFEPSRSDKSGAWAAFGWRRAMEALATETLSEIAASYPTPETAASEYHPDVPWLRADQKPRIDAALWPKAIALSDKAHMLAYEFLARPAAASQLLDAMIKLHAWVDEPELAAWPGLA